MAIRSVVTRGFGNGTFTGTIALVVTRGYAIGASAVVRHDSANLFGIRINIPDLTSVALARPDLTSIEFAIPDLSSIDLV